MARSVRQSKILEIISKKEIETQEELARELSFANFEITQATISRDIKELGLIKVLSQSGKYKYAVINTNEQAISTKSVNVLREVVLKIKQALNLVVVKTIKGAGSLCANGIDRLGFDSVLGVTYGDDCAFVAFESEDEAKDFENRLVGILEN